MIKLNLTIEIKYTTFLCTNIGKTTFPKNVGNIQLEGKRQQTTLFYKTTEMILKIIYLKKQ